MSALVYTETDLHSYIMLNNIKKQFNTYLETNRQNNEQHPTGWHQRVQEIYIHHYQKHVNDASSHRAELWRKYADKK